MPSSIPKTLIGTNSANSVTTSNESRPTSSSRRCAQKLRTWGSIANIARGVNTRDSNWRWIAWLGSCSWISVPGGISMSALTMSSRTPFSLLNVFLSMSAASTSAKRLTAQKSYRSL